MTDIMSCSCLRSPPFTGPVTVLEKVSTSPFQELSDKRSKLIFQLPGRVMSRPSTDSICIPRLLYGRPRSQPEKSPFAGGYKAPILEMALLTVWGSMESQTVVGVDRETRDLNQGVQSLPRGIKTAEGCRNISTVQLTPA